MTLVAEKPGLAERYGVAINASRLGFEEGRGSALDCVAAMGFARIALEEHGDRGERLAAELSPLLWRASYGRDMKAAAQADAVFAAWLGERPYFAEIERVVPGVVARFSVRVLDEYLSLRCVACGGTGWQEILSGGKRVRPRGRARNARLLACDGCGGNGRPRPSPVTRRRWLGVGRALVPAAEYEIFWRRQFVLAFKWLRQIASKTRDPLHRAR